MTHFSQTFCYDTSSEALKLKNLSQWLISLKMPNITTWKRNQTLNFLENSMGRQKLCKFQIFFVKKNIFFCLFYFKMPNITTKKRNKTLNFLENSMAAQKPCKFQFTKSKEKFTHFFTTRIRKFVVLSLCSFLKLLFSKTFQALLSSKWLKTRKFANLSLCSFLKLLFFKALLSSSWLKTRKSVKFFIFWQLHFWQTALFTFLLRVES